MRNINPAFRRSEGQLVKQAARSDQSEQLRVKSVRSWASKEQALITRCPRAYCSEFFEKAIHQRGCKPWHARIPSRLWPT
jgi:hypothetical protein